MFMQEKMRFKNFIFNRWPLLLLIGLSFMLPAIWLRERLVIAYAEGGFTHFLIDPFRLLRITPYIWWDIYGLGIENIRALPLVSYSLLTTSLQFLKFSPIFRQYLIFAITLLLSALTMYFLAIELIGKKNKTQLVALLSALFYILNPYTMNIWHRFTSAIFGLPLMPLIFLITTKFFKKSSFKYAFLFAIIILFFSVNAVNPAYFVSLFFPAIFYVIFEILRTRKFSQWRYLGLGLFLAIGLNFWWIFPLVLRVLQGSYNIGFLNDIGTLKAISQCIPLLFIIRLIDTSTIHWYGVNYSPGWIEFLIPALAIVAILLGKRNKNVLFFSLLLSIGLFLSKGLQSPGGAIFKWMFSHVPFFGMFRSPFEKFGLIIVFSYAFLVPFGLYSIWQRIKNKILKTGITVMILILLLGISVWPMWTGELFSFWQGIVSKGTEDVPTPRVEVPEYWQEAASFINQDKRDYRIIFLPQAPLDQIVYKWKHGYWGADFGSVNLLFNNPVITHLIWTPHADAYRKLVLEDLLLTGTRIYPSLFSPMNTEYILVRNDVNEVALSGMITGGMKVVPLAKIHRLLDSSEFVHKVRSFGKLDLYKLDDKYFLPHFYIPQNIIYSNGEVESLPDIVSFVDYPIRSGIYLADSTDNTDVNADNADEVFVKADLENPISEEELGEIAPELESVFFPYVRWKPGSLVYPLVLKKEELDEWGERDNPEQLFEKKLFYAAKRISEIEKWELALDENNWGKTIDRYEQKMEEAFEVLEKIKQEEKRSFFSLLAKLEVSLQAHQGRLENLRLSEEREVQFENIFEKLEEKLNQIKIKHDFSRLVYKFDIPKEEEYEVFIKKVEIEKLENWEIEVDGEKIDTGKVEIREDGWMNLGKKNFKEGEHELILHLPEPENLTGKNWQQFSDLETGDEGLFFSPQSIFPGSTSVGFQEIRDYTPNTIFRLTFNYRAQNGKAGFSVVQDSDKDEETGEMNPLITKTLRRTRGEEFEYTEILIKSNPRASLARLYLFAQPEEGKVADVKFKNFKVEKSREPAVLVRTKIDSTEERRIMPKITFVKVNPTKYKVKVEGVKEPYTLVFSESFHEGWKAYVQTSDIKPQTYGNIVANYFDGEIKEGTHKNIFLDKNTFETWGKKPISEERHLLVNGYANSWYITPQDSGGVDTYEIIIEFQPQKLFYLGLGISLAILLGCLGYLGYGFVRRGIKE